MKLIKLVIIFLYVGIQTSHAALVANLNNDIGPGASVADFQTIDANLPAGSAFFAINNAGGFNAARGAGALTSAAIPTAAGTTTIQADTFGAPQNNGFAVGAAAFNAGDPILGSNLFDVGANLGVTFSNLSTLDPGTQITVTGFGIGDNPNQDVTFTADFGGASQSSSTVFNTNIADSSDPTGSVPSAQFVFLADGVTDTLVLTSAPGPGGQNRSHINGFSISAIIIPEPTSLLVVAILSVSVLLIRQRRQLSENTI